MTDKPELSAADVLAMLDTGIYWATSTISDFVRVDAGKARLARAAVAAVCAERDALAAENKALREDAARLDWLWDQLRVTDARNIVYPHSVSDGYRAAIDKARKVTS